MFVIIFIVRYRVGSKVDNYICILCFGFEINFKQGKYKIYNMLGIESYYREINQNGRSQNCRNSYKFQSNQEIFSQKIVFL